MLPKRTASINVPASPRNKFSFFKWLGECIEDYRDEDIHPSQPDCLSELSFNTPFKTSLRDPCIESIQPEKPPRQSMR